MSDISVPIPAGWYPDPAGSFQQRWWTGESWTNDFAQYRPTLIHSAPAPEVLINQAAQPQMAASSDYLEQQAAATAMTASQAVGQQQAASMQSSGPTQTITRQQPATVDPLPAFRLPDADQPPQTSVAQPNAGNATLSAVTPAYRSAARDASFESEYLPFGSIRDDRQGYHLNPERRFTVAAWVIAVLPLVLGGAAYALATFVPVLYTTFTQVLLIILFLVVSVVLAAVDRRALRLDGHDATASPALALLTPLVFLPVRTALTTRETGRSSIALLIVELLIVAGIASALIFVDGLLQLILTATALY